MVEIIESNRKHNMLEDRYLHFGLVLYNTIAIEVNNTIPIIIKNAVLFVNFIPPTI
jgi:hypothetical protein